MSREFEEASKILERVREAVRSSKRPAIGFVDAVKLPASIHVSPADYDTLLDRFPEREPGRVITFMGIPIEADGAVADESIDVRYA